MTTRTVLPRRDNALLIAWMLCAVIVALVLLNYLAMSVNVGRGEVVLPLDDTYIHFQYARQIASGQPYVYNPGDPATSGGTSFIYPFLLGLGYALGFQGLNLGLWAMGIGALALLGSTWMVIHLARAGGVPFWLAVIGGLALPLSGPFAWHAMSGMETSLVVAFTLATLYAFVTWHYRMLAISAAILALTRPEGTIMAVIVTGVIVLRVWFSSLTGTRHHLHLPRGWIRWLGMIIAACLLQPLVNLTVTGSLSATGGQAKSILATVPFYMDTALRRILENFSRMWGELISGGMNWDSPGDFVPLVIGPLAVIGLIGTFIHPRLRFTGLLLLGWLLAVSAAIATLDTAFWHFKRYQMPLFALLFVLALWGLWSIQQFIAMRNRRIANPVATLILLTLFVTSLPTARNFLRLYRVNVQNVMAQPLPMARWLAANTPQDAVVGVHDVGMMRYIGQRYTIDMVGLTTRDAADSWRNGPGAVAGFLHNHTPQPDYVAAYTTARGLNYLADTSIYGELLVAFSADYAPEDNVALGAEFQGIYQTSWSAAARASQPYQSSVSSYIRGMDRTNHLNVAHLLSEHAYGYTWHNIVRTPGFATEVYEQTYMDCVPIFAGGSCQSILDTGRRINGEEAFTMQTHPGMDAILVTRVQPLTAGAFDVYIDDILIATRWIPAVPGRWLEIPTLIPATHITGESIRVRIVPDVPGGHYRPFRHWLYQGEYTPASAVPGNISFQDGAIHLSAELARDATEVFSVILNWSTDGSAQGDYKVFVHLYDDINQPPIAQMDAYSAGTMPPGNWLPGMISDLLVVDLGEIPSGIYQVAIGLYEASTFDRLLPAVIDPNIPVDEAGRRVFIGEIEVP